MTLRSQFQPNLLTLALGLVMIGGCASSANTSDARIATLETSVGDLRREVIALERAYKVLSDASSDNSHSIEQNSQAIITLARKMK